MSVNARSVLPAVKTVELLHPGDPEAAVSLELWSDYLDCRGYRAVEIAIIWNAVVGNAGTLHLQASPLAQVEPHRFIEDIPVTSGAFGDWPTVTADEGIAVIQLINPLSYHRIYFDGTAGTGIYNLADDAGNPTDMRIYATLVR